MYKYVFLLRFEDPLSPVPIVDAFFDATHLQGWNRNKLNAANEFGFDAECILRDVRTVSQMALRAKYDGKILDTPLSVITEEVIDREKLQTILQAMSLESLRSFIDDAKMR